MNKCIKLTLNFGYFVGLGYAVIPGYRYTIKSVVNAIVESKCTHFFGVPTMLIDIINYVEDNKIKIETLKSIVVAAATVPFEVVNKFTKIVKSLEKVEIVYGTTETSPIISTPMPGEKIINTLDNVGVPLDFVEVKIVDKESGDIVKIGEKGYKFLNIIIISPIKLIFEF